jgi:hypothetical protein
MYDTGRSTGHLRLIGNIGVYHVLLCQKVREASEMFLRGLFVDDSRMESETTALERKGRPQTQESTAFNRVLTDGLTGSKMPKYIGSEHIARVRGYKSYISATPYTVH